MLPGRSRLACPTPLCGKRQAGLERLFLLQSPLKEGALVQDDAVAHPAHDLIEAVVLGMEDKVTQTADVRPGVELRPVGQQDEPGFAGAVSVPVHRIGVMTSAREALGRTAALRKKAASAPPDGLLQKDGLSVLSIVTVFTAIGRRCSGGERATRTDSIR